MKIKSARLSNFAGYGKVEVNFDENITYLIGKNGSGKSTIGITAIWATLQGIAEKSKTALIGERFRFIGNGAVSASTGLTLFDEKNNVTIEVDNRITKTGNELSFKAPEGYPVGKEWLDNLFNVFLIAPKKFIELSPKQQAEALGIDTSEFDEAIKSLKSEYTLINRDLSNIGNLVPIIPTEKVDISALNQQKNEIIIFNNQQRERQAKVDQAQARLGQLEEELLEIYNKIEALKKEAEENIKNQDIGKSFLKHLPAVEPLKAVNDIDEKINNASETNQKAFLYEQYQVNIEKKKNTENKKKQAAELEKRVNYIKSQKLPFDNLTISEDGELLLSGKPIKEPYFSTGELLKIVPVLMSAKNPELKYVFIQDFNLLDEDQQLKVEEALTAKGMQLVIEMVGTKKIEDKNCILLKDCKVVESYAENTTIL